MTDATNEILRHRGRFVKNNKTPRVTRDDDNNIIMI